MTWQTKKLGEVCEIYQPKTISKKEMVSGGQFFVFGANGIIGKYNKFNHESSELLITCRGATCGSVNVSVPQSWINGNAMVIRPKDEKVLLRGFLRYFFIGIDLSSVITGSAQPQITRQMLSPFPIPLPPLPEQKRIVKILDEVFERAARAKENAEKNLENSRELFESHLQNVFDNSKLKNQKLKSQSQHEKWEEKTFAEISLEFGRGKSKHRPRNDKKLYGGKYPFIQTGDIRNSNHFITEYSQTYNEAGLAQSKLWPKGTICITIAANIAETGILNFDACFPDSVIGLVIDPKKANENFVEYLLQSFKAQLQAKGKGSAQANINMGTFEYEKFPIPNIAAQKSIASKLDALSAQTKKLEGIYKQKLADLEELKKSVLKKAFSGGL